MGRRGEAGNGPRAAKAANRFALEAAGIDDMASRRSSWRRGAPVSYTDWSLVRIGDVEAGEKGLFARVPIAEDQVIGCFDGRATLFEVDEDGRITDPRWSHRETIQLCRIGTYLLALTPVDDFDGIDYLNHSCKPNAGIRKGVVLVATRAIEENEQITIDYRAVDHVLEDKKCWCEPSRCVI